MSALNLKTNYTRIAADYDKDREEFLPFDKALASALTRALESAGAEGCPQRLLDLACGTGTVLEALEGDAGPWSQWERFGMDASDAMLSVASSKLQGTPLTRAGATGLPLADGSLGCILSTFAFHHFGKLEPFLGEMKRVLATGGRLVLRNILPLDPPHPLLHEIFEGTSEVDSRRFPTRQGLLDALAASGLRVEREHRVDSEHDFTPDRFAELCSKRTISQLDLISDEQFAAGMERLKTMARDEPDRRLRECIPHYTVVSIRD